MAELANHVIDLIVAVAFALVMIAYTAWVLVVCWYHAAAWFWPRPDQDPLHDRRYSLG